MEEIRNMASYAPRIEKLLSMTVYKCSKCGSIVAYKNSEGFSCVKEVCSIGHNIDWSNENIDGNQTT